MPSLLDTNAFHVNQNALYLDQKHFDDERNAFVLNQKHFDDERNVFVLNQKHFDDERNRSYQHRNRFDVDKNRFHVEQSVIDAFDADVFFKIIAKKNIARANNYLLYKLNYTIEKFFWFFGMYPMAAADDCL